MNFIAMVTSASKPAFNAKMPQPFCVTKTISVLPASSSHNKSNTTRHPLGPFCTAFGLLKYCLAMLFNERRQSRRVCWDSTKKHSFSAHRTAEPLLIFPRNLGRPCRSCLLSLLRSRQLSLQSRQLYRRIRRIISRPIPLNKRYQRRKIRNIFCMPCLCHSLFLLSIRQFVYRPLL